MPAEVHYTRRIKGEVVERDLLFFSEAFTDARVTIAAVLQARSEPAPAFTIGFDGINVPPCRWIACHFPNGKLGCVPAFEAGY